MCSYRSPEKVCCVFRCHFRVSSENKASIKLHEFPLKGTLFKGEDLFFKWIEAIKLPSRITKEMKVCSRHFTEEDFTIQGYSWFSFLAIKNISIKNKRM